MKKKFGIIIAIKKEKDIMEKKKNMFVITEGANENYLALITRIGKIHPIKDADNLVRTVVNGFDVVISKDMKEGDIVVYIPVETEISEKYLSSNNLYELEEYRKNANASEIELLLAKEKECFLYEKPKEAKEIHEEAKRKTGYFTKKNRVRMVKLRGCYSNGFIAGIDSLVNYNPNLANCNWDELVGTYFNEINGEEFCKKFVPLVKENTPTVRNNNKSSKKAQKKVDKNDKIIRGQWNFHYDTKRIDGTNIHTLLHPSNVVTISVKVHGALAEIARVLVKKQNPSRWEKFKMFLGFKVCEYGNIYSSHRVIKNKYYNDGNINNFYTTDIWGCVNRVFSPYLTDGMTVYGEVVGYEEGETKMIQKNHDYGCKPGQWKFMPYRITETNKKGVVKEWNVLDVDAWTKNLVKKHPEVEEYVLNLNILYHGKLSELYPDIEINSDWYDNFLERIKNDKNFYMELKEPMCHLYERESSVAKEALDKAIENKESKKIISNLTKEYEKWENMRAPREGIVIRIDNDPHSEAFKIKTNEHYMMETKQHDNGEIDIEEIS